jgi:hypothetical protein
MTARRMAALLAAAAALALTLAGCDAPRQISDSGFGAYEVSMAAWDDGVAVTWYDTRDGNAEVYVRMLDAEGREVGAETRLTQSVEQSYEPDIAATPNGFAIAWYEKSAAGALRARLGFWDRERKQLWTQALGAEGRETRTPVVRVRGDTLFVAWIEVEDGQHFVWGQWRGLDGNPLGAPTRLALAGATTWNLNAAIDTRGVPFVVFDALAGTKAQEIFLVEDVGSGPVLSRLGADDAHNSEYPDIAFGPDGEIALTWFDSRDGNDEVYLAGGTLAELRSDLAAHQHRVTDTPGSSIGAYLAWNGERIGLAWSDDSTGSYEIFYRPFAVSGDALGAQKRLTDNATNSLIPAIRAWRDGFAVAWNEITPGAGGAHDPDTRSEVLFALVR